METTTSKWIIPSEVLEKYERKELTLLFATVASLRSLAEFTSVDEVITSTRGKEIQPILPKVVRGGGQVKIYLPQDPEYDQITGESKE